MNFYNFGSGSSGNCYLLDLERPGRASAKILLEAGIGYTDLLTRMSSYGLNLTDVDAALISHEHKDHAALAKTLAKRGMRVYGNARVCSSPTYECKHKMVKCVASGVYVIPFKVEHDAPDTFGYLISTEAESVLFWTDCKYIRADLSHYKPYYILAEANYDGRVIHFAMEEAERADDRGNIFRYKRLLQSHMSLMNCIKTLRTLDLTNTKAIFLIHLSERHANESYFKKTVEDSTGVQTFVCKKSGGIV